MRGRGSALGAEGPPPPRVGQRLRAGCGGVCVGGPRGRGRASVAGAGGTPSGAGLHAEPGSRRARPRRVSSR